MMKTSNISNATNINSIIPKKTPSPAEFLSQAVGRKVLVKLNNNTEYKGILICLDGTMNVYLQQCEEYIKGELTNRYAELFIRGNNGKYQVVKTTFLIFFSILHKLRNIK